MDTNNVNPEHHLGTISGYTCRVLTIFCLYNRDARKYPRYLIQDPPLQNNLGCRQTKGWYLPV